MLFLSLSTASAVPSIDTPVQTGATAPDEAALIVGIEDYFVLPDVPHARRDADAFYAFLTQTRGVGPDRIRRLDRANREQILAALDELEAGVVWVYFAGHGAASPDTGERVLLGVDTQPDLATFTARAVKVAEIRERASRGGQAVLVLDTCYSGFGRAGVDLLDGKRFAVPDFVTGPTPGVIEWSAAGPNEWSGALEPADHGAFTWAVLGALRGWADADADGATTLAEAHTYVGRALATLQITDQHPQLQGDTSFVLSTATEPAPVLTLPPSAPPDGGATTGIEPSPGGPVQIGEPGLPDIAPAPDTGLHDSPGQVGDPGRPRIAPAPDPGSSVGTQAGVVSGAAKPHALELSLARALDKLTDKGWLVDAVRFEATGTGLPPITSVRGQAWVTCDGEIHEVIVPVIGGTGDWAYRAQTFAKRVKREVPCR